MYVPLRLQFGPKQAPAIYQCVQETEIGSEYKPNGEKLADVFFDDTHVGDKTFPEHVQSLEQLFSRARACGIQYRLEKCRFAFPETLLIGFVVGESGRRVDPVKIEQLRKWPEYRNGSDVVSHIQFCQYLSEFYGPRFPEKLKPLRAYAKDGVDFSGYATDEAAKAARQWLIETMI